MIKVSILILLTFIVFSIKAAGEENTLDDLIKEGMNSYYLGSYEKAKEIFDKAISLYPSSSEAWYAKGLALELEGISYSGAESVSYFNQAKTCFNRAIELNPNNANAYMDLAWTESELGNFDAAHQLIDKSIKMNPNNAEAYNVKGEIYYQSGDYDNALMWYNKAKEIKPAYGTWKNIGKVKTAMGDKVGAEKANTEAKLIQGRE